MPARIRISSRSKYGVAAAIDRTFQGIVYHSKAEMLHAQELHTRAITGDIWFWWRQVKFKIVVQGVFICDVVIDFSVQKEPNGPLEYHEIKGHETAEWKLKRKLLFACYPNINLKVIKV